MWNRSRSVIRNTAVVLSVLAAISSIVLMLAVLADVVSRQSGNGSFPGLLEVSESLLVLITFLGMAHAERLNVHVRTNLLTERLSSAGRRVVHMFTYSIYLAFVLWWTVASVERAVESVGRGEFRTGLIHFPVYPGRVALAVGLISLSAILVVKLVDVILKDEETTSLIDSLTGISDGDRDAEMSDKDHPSPS